jgi:hypothetical protein
MVTENVFAKMTRQLTACHVMSDAETTGEYFERATGLTGLWNRLECLLGQTWSNLWLKSPPQPAHNKISSLGQLRARSSVYRLLQNHCQPDTAEL